MEFDSNTLDDVGVVPVPWVLSGFACVCHQICGKSLTHFYTNNVGRRRDNRSAKSPMVVVQRLRLWGHAAHHTDRRQGRVDHRQLSDPKSKRPRPASGGLSCLRLFLTAYVPENVLSGGCGPDLPCYPPPSHGSSKFEVDDRRIRGFRAPRRWELHTPTPRTTSEAFPTPSNPVSAP